MISNVLVSFTYSPVSCDSMEKESKFSAAVNGVKRRVTVARKCFSVELRLCHVFSIPFLITIFPVNPGNKVVSWSTRGFSFQRLNEAQSITLQ